MENDWLNIFDGFYRSGSLVFGGGHVILPLLQAEVVPQGWATKDQFIAGYGAAQAVPGPLLTFSAYLGTVKGGWTVGLFALGAIFLPSFLLVIGVLPFWDKLRSRTSFRAALMGVNAAVVGLVGAALYDPVWTTAITSREDLALGAAAFGLLAFWKWPPLARRSALGNRRSWAVADIIALYLIRSYKVAVSDANAPSVIPAQAGIQNARSARIW